MNIKELTDDELSLAIGKAVLPEHEFRDWSDAEWDEFMPLALDCNIFIAPLLCKIDGDHTGDYKVELRDWTYATKAVCDNPLRALKECLLQVLQEANNEYRR